MSLGSSVNRFERCATPKYEPDACDYHHTMNDGASESYFDFTIDSDATPPTVTASGELDAASSTEFARAIDRVLGMGAGITLDLGAVTFIDSSALRVVSLALRRAEDEGQAFSVPAASDAVRRIFEITGLSSFLAS